MFGVKTPSEFVELSTKHAREQFETLTGQGKELAGLAQKVATDTAEPIKSRRVQGDEEGRLSAHEVSSVRVSPGRLPGLFL